MSILLVDLCSGTRDEWEQSALLAQALQHSALRADGEEILLACPKMSALAEVARAMELPLAELGTDKTGLPLWWRMRSLIRKHGISVLHSLDTASLLISAWLRSRRSSLRLVYTMHHLEEKADSLSLWKLRQPDRLVFPGSSLRDSAINIDLAKACVILPIWGPWGPIWGTSVLREDRRHRRAAAGDRFIFVSVGSSTPDADIPSLLRAMACLQDMNRELPPWEVRVVGHGPLVPELLELAESLGILDRLAFLGAQDYRQIMPECDAMVCQTAQGNGMVSALLAAWDYELPVISVDLPAHCEIGEDKKSMLFSPRFDPNALAHSMLQVIQDQETRAHLLEGGKQALRRFRPERMADEYAVLYRELREDAMASLNAEKQKRL